jgi:hypothetical protein
MPVTSVRRPVVASLVAPRCPLWLTVWPISLTLSPFIFRAVADPNPGFEVVRVVAGPMARSVVDLERMARVLFGEHGGREDYFLAPVPYRDVALPEKLRLGYYLNGASSATLINNGLMRTSNRRIGEGISCLSQGRVGNRGGAS